MMKNLLRRLRMNKKKNSQSGVALLMAIFAMTLLTTIAVEVQYGTNIESLSASQGLNRLRAYYAAKAGVEMSLFRILIYKKALAQFGKDLGPNASMLDKIWQMPLPWPLPLPKDALRTTQDEVNKVLKESIFDGKYMTTIENESAKLDINDLGSQSKNLREATQIKILNIFNAKLKGEDKWAEDYQGYDFEKLVNNMIDWVDEDTVSLNSGDENSLYTESDATDLPPNQPFKTLQELHMVAGMEDDFFDVLAPNITVYGSKAINVNQAPKDVLMSLDPSIEKETADKIIERRSDELKGGPFQDEKDFFSFLEGLGLRTNSLKEKNIPLEFDSILNFRVTSVGNYSNMSRKVVAIVYDFDRVKDRLKDILTKEKTSGKQDPDKDPGGVNPVTPAAGEKPPAEPEKKAEIPKGRPQVVYWFEN
ncbi:MAG: type II secretion system protein GspK [Pseudomonadota bacterium]|nr:type II secretion system protein GspK [Pseudomonadota bacterium]